MTRMLLATDLIKLIEQKMNSKIYHICGICEMGDIEGTDFKEFQIMVYEENHLNYIKILTDDVINVKEVIFIKEWVALTLDSI